MPLNQPLDAIAQWASNIRQGRFSSRLSLDDHQYAEVENDINRLAEWLQSLVQERDAELELKSQKISRQSRTLELVYALTESLNKTDDVTAFISNFLGVMKQASGAVLAQAYLHNSNGETELLATLPELEAMLASEHASPDLAKKNLLIVPIRYQEATMGEYHLHLDKPLDTVLPDTRAVMKNIGLNLGMALQKNRNDREMLKLGRMEERTKLAHELHDSLAQTLASLRFQVRTLDSVIQAGDEEGSVAQLEKVEGLLDAAHDELRSLIGQFRAPIVSGSLSAGFNSLIKQFRDNQGIPIFYHNQWDEVELSEDVEMNVIRIAQEALQNIGKHAKADTVRILMRKSRSGLYQMIIEDDGLGIDPTEHPDEVDNSGYHIGLSVMRERAALMGGELGIESEPDEGTRILLSFTP